MLDLGSGSGKACYIISQIVGARGRVIGIDFNPPMLELARKYQRSIGDKLGYHNVEFRRGKIQDLKTDLELLDQHLKENPVRSVADLAHLEEFERRMRREQPLIADESIDVIVSSCVLNLVRAGRQEATLHGNVPRAQARRTSSDFRHRQRRAGAGSFGARPESLERLRFGRFQEEEFLRAFEEAKFHGVQIEDFDSKPYQTVEGIEFRAITVTAYKGKEGPCIERNQAVIYRGPWKQVVRRRRPYAGARRADGGVRQNLRTLFAGAVLPGNLSSCRRGTKSPWITPACFDCARDHKRHPRETKGVDFKITQLSGGACGPNSNCCP